MKSLVGEKLKDRVLKINKSKNLETIKMKEEENIQRDKRVLRKNIFCTANKVKADIIIGEK